jgi:hypothetical protein
LARKGQEAGQNKYRENKYISSHIHPLMQPAAQRRDEQPSVSALGIWQGDNLSMRPSERPCSQNGKVRSGQISSLRPTIPFPLGPTYLKLQLFDHAEDRHIDRVLWKVPPSPFPRRRSTFFSNLLNQSPAPSEIPLQRQDA